MDFSERLLTLRKSLDITQEQLTKFAVSHIPLECISCL